MARHEKNVRRKPLDRPAARVSPHFRPQFGSMAAALRAVAEGQSLASRDVSDLIKRLRDSGAGETQEATATV